MFRLNKSERTPPLLRLRYADEWVGLLVISCVVLFVAAIAEAGILRSWLSPPGRLHLELPANDLAGITVGDDVQIMGIHAGTIRKVQFVGTKHMYAVAEIERQMEPLIRQDSHAVIRRQFVVAGATYIDLSRGAGPELDWQFAELPATVEPNPADQITATISDVRRELIPTMRNANDVTAQLDGMMKDIRAGHGTIGGLMSNDEILQRAQAVLTSLNETLARVQPLEGKVSGVLDQAHGTMGNLQSASSDLKAQMPKIRSVADHVNNSTSELPALITQAQTAAASLEKLTNQMRSLWILGGGGQKAPSHRLPAGAISP